MKKEARETRAPLGRVTGAVRKGSDALFGDPYIECRGWRRVTVDGAKKIEVMAKERVVVLLRRGRLVICGGELICVSFRNGTLVVEGAIESVGKWGQDA